MGLYYGRNEQYLRKKGHRFFFTWAPGPQFSDQQHGFKGLEVTCMYHGVGTRPLFEPPGALVRHDGLVLWTKWAISGNKGAPIFLHLGARPSSQRLAARFKELEVTSICNGVDTWPFFAPPAALVRQLGWYYGRNKPNWE
jgi:hypothetical protein